MEQQFDDDKVNVSKNGVFAEEFAINIREWMLELEMRIGELCSHSVIVIPCHTAQLRKPSMLAV